MQAGQPNPRSVAPEKPLNTTEDPELADRFNRVLSLAVEAMDASGLRYAFIGGIASGGLGRPRSTRDIDLFVTPEDAELALRALSRKGFRIERTDPSWLYKAFFDDVLVDVIFKSRGEIYLDAEMRERTITAEWHGKKLKFVAPEDLLIIKAVAHSEATPGHWHDAIGLLSHASLDWNYLLKRARRAPRRVLSLLLYAQSNDVWVPNHAVHELYRSIFGDDLLASVSRPVSAEPVRQAPRARPSAPGPGVPRQAWREYAVAHLREALAYDPRTNELDITIELAEDKVLLRGEVSENERREAVGELAREHFPGLTIENQVRILRVADCGDSSEDMS